MQCKVCTHPNEPRLRPAKKCEKNSATLGTRLDMKAEHISDHDLERYYLGMVTEEEELAPLEETSCAAPRALSGRRKCRIMWMPSASRPTTIYHRTRCERRLPPCSLA
jgi:hypothetical protein